MTDTRPGEVKAGWWPRWRGTVLVVSLALNLLVAGMVGAAAFRHRLAPPPGPGVQANVFGFARELGNSRRSQIWAATNAERQALRPFRQELRRARSDVSAALAAEPFDAALFKAAHERLLKSEIGARTAAHALFDAMVMQLSPAERREFARWQPRGAPAWRRGGGGFLGQRPGGPPMGPGGGDDEPAVAVPPTAPAPAKP